MPEISLNGKSYPNSKTCVLIEMPTVKSEFVAAATILFEALLLRPQFKGGLYLRAATNSS